MRPRKRSCGWTESPVLERNALRERIEGPAILEEHTTTTVIPPGFPRSEDHGKKPRPLGGQRNTRDRVATVDNKLTTNSILPTIGGTQYVTLYKFVVVAYRKWPERPLSLEFQERS